MQSDIERIMRTRVCSEQDACFYLQHDHMQAAIDAKQALIDELVEALEFIVRAADTEPAMAIYKAHIDQGRAVIARAKKKEE